VDPQQVVREKCDFRSSEVAITERSVFAATRRKNALRRTLQPSQEQTGVVACAHKDGVDRIASGSGEGIRSTRSWLLEWPMTDSITLRLRSSRLIISVRITALCER